MTDAATTIKRRLATLLTKDERPSQLFERLGAFTLADRLDEIRTDGDVVAMHLPLGPGQLRSHRIKLHGFEGRDTTVRAIQDNGWRGFEAPTPEMIVRVVRGFAGEDGIVYDIGANSGIYALLAAEARPDTRVVAFEPFPPALEALRANLALNRSRSRIEVVESAVSDSTSTALLHVPTQVGCLETSASLNQLFKEHHEAAVEVRTTTLDDDWHARGRPAVSVIKIDTETTEDEVLRGAVELVRSERPVIFYELLPGGKADAIAAFADELDLVNVRMTTTSATVDTRVEHDPRGWNQILVPRERSGEIVPPLEAAGLAVTFGDDASEPDDAGIDARWGSGEATIEQVDIVGAGPSPTPTIKTGDAVIVRMRFDAKERIERPVFGLAIFAADGTLLTGPNTREAELDCDAIEGTGTVELSIDRLLLLPGTYELSVSLYDHALAHAYDFRDRVVRFRIEEGTPRETYGGVLSLGGRWSIRPSDRPDQAPRR